MKYFITSFIISLIIILLGYTIITQNKNTKLTEQEKTYRALRYLIYIIIIIIIIGVAIKILFFSKLFM